MSKTWFEKNFGDISMLVILIPGLAFLMTYAYFDGYCSYFNIPSGLISIGAKDIASMVLLVLIAIFCFFLFDFMLVQFFFRFFFNCYPLNSKVSQDQFLRYSFIILFLCIVIPMEIINPIPINLLIMFICAPTLLLVGFIISHILFIRKKKRNVKIQMIDQENEKEDKVFSGIIERIFGTRLVFTILFVIFLYVFTMNYGKYTARMQNTFYSFINRNDIVGILINDENYLIAKYLDDKELSRTEVITISDGLCLELKANPEFVKLVTEYNELKKSTKR